MFCKKCGKELKEGSRFCMGCGAPTSESQPTAAQPQPQPQPQPYQQPMNTINISGFSLTDNLRHKDAPIKKTGLLYLSHLVCIIAMILTFIRPWIGTTERDSIFYYLYNSNLFSMARMLLLVFACYVMKENKNIKETSVCPKCKGMTHHNKYHVCESCGYDSMFVALFSASTYCVSVVTDIVRNAIMIFGRYYMDHSTEIAFQFIYLFIFIMHISVFIAPIYYYPAKMARRNEHPATTAITVLNYLFGATILFWIILLIWASSYSKPSMMNVQIQQNQPAPQPTAPTLADKLAELDSLKDQGLISQEEYEAMRSRIFEKV